MQVLKDEVRNRIFEAALREFKEKGYEGASMREIAKDAGLSVGNLYRYFENKEKLFYAIIGPVYNRLIDLTKDCFHYKLTHDESSFLDYLTDSILSNSRQYGVEMSILLNGSKGTQYEKAKEDIISLVEGFAKQIVTRNQERKKMTLKYDYLCQVVAVLLIEGISMIMGHFDNEDEAREATKLFVTFYLKDAVNRIQ